MSLQDAFYRYSYIICIVIDINECDVGTDNCHPNATCMDSVGSFECSCNSGFTGSGVTCLGEFSNY